MAAIGAALAIAGVGGGAHAAQAASQTQGPSQAQTQSQASTAAASAASAFGDTGNNVTVHATTPRKTMQWDTKGRWGLKLDVQQPTANSGQWQSIDAGPFYKVTPRLHIGGTVGVDSQTDPRFAAPGQQQAQPRVRLETTFKF